MYRSKRTCFYSLAPALVKQELFVSVMLAQRDVASTSFPEVIQGVRSTMRLHRLLKWAFDPSFHPENCWIITAASTKPVSRHNIERLRTLKASFWYTHPTRGSGPAGPTQPVFALSRIGKSVREKKRMKKGHQILRQRGKFGCILLAKFQSRGERI